LASDNRVTVGATFQRQETFDEDRVSRFVAVTGDSNPIHAGAGGIVPGSLCAAMFPAIIGSQFPGVMYLSQSLKFRKAIQVGTPVQATVTVKRMRVGYVVFNTVCHIAGSPTIVVDGEALALFGAEVNLEA